jgi:Ca2+-binding EF-hand superfamily protein
MKRYCLIAAFLLATPIALAKDGQSPRGEDFRARAEARFSEADRNRDGKLSLAEMQDAQDQRLAERFAKLDANKDGGVSQDELRQAHQQRREQRHSRRAGMHAMRAKLLALDVDNDEALTRAEIGDKLPRLAENFDRIDADRNGKLTREEMRAARGSLSAKPR